MRILLVEDDKMIGDAMCVALRDDAYAVDWVQDGESALLALGNAEYQAVLLDLGLPKQDGLDVLKKLRSNDSKLPVIIITARDAPGDRVKGLDLGADDYLVKPFDIDELLARLRAALRRQGGHAAPLLSNGIISLNPATREASKGDVTCILSAREFSLLQALLLSPGSIQNRSQLEETIYGWNEEVESNAVDFLIHGIRKKFGPDTIKNVRGAGWMVVRNK